MKIETDIVFKLILKKGGMDSEPLALESANEVCLQKLSRIKAYVAQQTLPAPPSGSKVGVPALRN